MARLAVLAAFALGLAGCGNKVSQSADFSSRGIQGVRFDPSYYYGLKQPLRDFVDSSVSAWQGRGVNTVFFKAYDPEFGAVYETGHPGNARTDYADKDLLRLFLDACHGRGMRLVAWLPVFGHKGAWEAHPDWRMKAEDGSDYLPAPDHHPLCVRQEGFRTWWSGFLAELLADYPDLDGVDFAEPAIVWRKGETCFCPVCRKANTPAGGDPFATDAVDRRAQGLTEILLLSSRQVKAAGRIACVTFIGTADASTELMAFGKQKELTGIDVDALLDSPDRPEWLSVELMWQQWADAFDNPASFRPDWTRKAVEQSLARIGGRAHMLAHVEITPLGAVEVSPAEFTESIRAARRGGAQSIEFYDTHLADSLGAWTSLEAAWREESGRGALVLHDPGGEGAALQMATLFGHFGLATRVAVVDSFSEARLGPNDLLAYVGTKENHPLPAAFLAHAAKPGARLFWADFNLGQMDSAALARLGLRYLGSRRSPEFAYVEYKGQELFKSDSTLNLVAVDDSAKAKVHAVARSTRGGSHPYIVQSGGFWYVADCPVDYIEEGGRDLAFADALHEFVGDLHGEKHTALVRIEDVCPLTDPAALRSIADLLDAQGVPFTIALVPFYVDPEENTSVSLSDRPEFLKALRYAVGKGAAIALHGSTHQYRGRSTHDFEFWDALHDSPLLEDSKEYVRLRIQRGVDEMRRNGIYPIVFETPHYAASQLDYGVIDRHFSAEYGRRQVIDRTGFDQLVPYFIARHPSGTSIIPENLGYVPNDKQVAAPLLRFARNNLAVRDGFASFFFHPWIDHRALADLVKGLKDMGYAFADIRGIPLKAEADGMAHVTGSQEVSLDPGGRHLRTFFLDSRGGRHEEWISDGPVTSAFTREVHCPPGWSFVAEALDAKPTWLSRLPLPGPGVLDKAKAGLLTAAPLKLIRGRPAHPLLIQGPASHRSENAAANAAGRPAVPAAPPGGPETLFPPSQAAWSRALAACGIDADTVSTGRFLEIPADANLVVVPAEAGRRLSPQQASLLARWTSQGGSLILEGPSAVSAQLGLSAADSGQSTREIRDDYLPGVPIRWPSPSRYLRFDAEGEYVNQFSAPGDEPLVASGRHGEGKWIFFAAPFAAPGSDAPDRFPFLLDMVQRELGLYPALKAPNLEVYFDPGAREEVPVEDLVANWRRNGVRAVYLAGWHDYKRYTFEYAYTVSLLHQHGMLAYAWLDLPHVSDRFWHEHPAWREKTAAGADAEMDADIGWKQSMNLTNDTCRAGAYNALKRLLMMAPWDGAVLTGRIFSGDDPDSLGRITPFHPSFRERYARDRGYDPARLFDPAAPQSVKRSRRSWEEFLAYRDSVEQALTLDALAFLKSQRALQRPGAEIILTRDFIGATPSADSLYRRIMAGVAAEAAGGRTAGNAAGSARVRIQAPASRQALDAAALERDVAAWKAAYPRWQPMLEIDFAKQKPRSGATPQLAGLELMEVVAAAERVGARLSLRTEADLYDTDFRNLAYAAAASARESFQGGAWTLATRGRTIVELDGDAVRQVLVDGSAWPAYDRGRLLLPSGDHRVEGAARLASWQALLQAPARITGFNGAITGARGTLQGLELGYESAHPVSLALSMPAVEATLDGLPLETGAGETGAGREAKGASATLSLPAGSHRVGIATRPLSSSLMRRASVSLSVAVIAISSLTVLAFGLLWTGGWMRRLYAGDGTGEGQDPGPPPAASRPKREPGKVK